MAIMLETHAMEVTNSDCCPLNERVPSSPNDDSERGEIEDNIPDVNAVIKLSVGGAKFVTSSQTLCSDGDSMLAAMFSGRWLVPQVDDGYQLIDRNGSIFSNILDHLRGGGAILPSQSRREMDMLRREAVYFNLASLIRKIDNHDMNARSVRLLFHQWSYDFKIRHLRKESGSALAVYIEEHYKKHIDSAMPPIDLCASYVCQHDRDNHSQHLGDFSKEFHRGKRFTDFWHKMNAFADVISSKWEVDPLLISLSDRNVKMVKELLIKAESGNRSGGKLNSRCRYFTELMTKCALDVLAVYLRNEQEGPEMMMMMPNLRLILETELSRILISMEPESRRMAVTAIHSSAIVKNATIFVFEYFGLTDGMHLLATRKNSA